MSYSTTSTILFLLLFVSFYVISLSTYTYILSLSDGDIKEIEGEKKIRVKRIAAVDTDDEQPGKHTSINTNILFRCCAKNQYLNQKYQCDYEDKLIPEDLLLKKVANYVIDENTLEIRDIKYIKGVKLNENYILKLRDENSFAVNWSSSVLEENYAFSYQDISLLELNENKSKVVNKFPQSSFCLDFLMSENVLVAYVNPCAGKLCLQKCCPKKQYYNFVEKKCITDPNIPELVPIFYMGTTNVLKLPYYFIQNTLQCAVPSLISKLQANHLKPEIYIQENGSLISFNEKQKQRRLYPKTNYCLEQFSDGTKEDAFVNGLFCPLEQNIVDIGIQVFSKKCEFNLDEEDFDIKNDSKLSYKSEARRDLDFEGDSKISNILKSHKDSPMMPNHVLFDEQTSAGTAYSRLFSMEWTVAGCALILFMY